MTDAEKVKFLVEMLFGGKWPEHKMIPLPADDMCYRCESHWHDFTYSNPDSEEPDGCEEWNPIKRIEDAFMVVEEMYSKGVTGFCLYGPDSRGLTGFGCHWVDITNSVCYSETPQEAIVNSSIAALEAR